MASNGGATGADMSSGDKPEEFVWPRAQQVQVDADSEHRRGFGKQALFNYTSYIGHAPRQGNA